MTNQQKDEIIKSAIRSGLSIYDKFHKTETLILVNYNILKAIFIDNKKHIVLSAPTGSGKSVIGYLLNYCYHYISHKFENLDFDMSKFELEYSKTNSYMLTSSKLLQEQLDGDFDKFNLGSDFSMLKGIKNYECTKLTAETKLYHDYSQRYCLGMSMVDKAMLPCFESCPYIQKRAATSRANCAVLNYSYFLNVLKNGHSAFFGERDLVISDEAHLIPEIVINQFNLELTAFNLNKIMRTMQDMAMNFPSLFNDKLYPLQDDLGLCFKFFFKEKININDTKEFLTQYIKLVRDFSNMYSVAIRTSNDKNEVIKEMFGKAVTDIEVSIKYYDFDAFLEDLETRPEDIFIKTEYINVGNYAQLGTTLNTGSYRVYRHKINDMNEAAMCRKYYLSKVNANIYMSATIGNMNEFAALMGLEKNEFVGFRLESNFDFSKSPIHIIKSGYLNYNNFNTNIDKIINDTLYICENLHTNDKGIIHTSTFNIAELLRQKVIQGFVTNKKRYLFYSNSDEKEACIELMKVGSNIPYVIIGPSLYEGIDLKDDAGRFNIVMKAPYQSMNDYTKEKMKRFPFWYERLTLEKLEQSIGRTNRHINDYSTTYLLDSVLEKLIFKLPTHITKRLKYTKLNQL